MENGHKWSWKVLENAHKKVLESHGKALYYSVLTLCLLYYAATTEDLCFACFKGMAFPPSSRLQQS